MKIADCMSCRARGCGEGDVIEYNRTTGTVVECRRCGFVLKREERESIAAYYERAILAALAEQAAGEAERVREAVAATYEDAAQALREQAAICRGLRVRRTVAPAADAYDDAAQRVLRARARATAPAPEPHPAGRAATDAAKAARARGEDVYADGEGRCEVVPAAAPVASAERAVVEAAEAWRDGLTTAMDDESNTLIAAVDALAAARKGGG